MYNDFWTQTPLGLLEFSDQPIQTVPEADQYHGFFKARHVASYLEDYCDGHVYSDASLRSRIWTNEPVVSVRKVDKVWRVETRSGNLHEAGQLVDASGLTSAPNFPHFSERDSFKGSLIHHKDFAAWEHHLKSAEGRNIIVLGGAKSAADVAYACAKSGQNVTWLIRRSGSGPAAFVSAKGRMAYANSNESFYTRFTSLFLVSLFSLSMGYERLLGYINQTGPGQRLLRNIWQNINAKAWKEADYDRPDGRANGFHNLKPDTELFWQNDSTGINQRADFFDTIARNVRVVREDLSHLCESGIVLNGGEVLQADTIICATGWKTQHPYLDEHLAAHLGLPVPTHILPADQTARWEELDAEADRGVLTTFPILNSTWARANDNRAPDDKSTTPFRLWHALLPPRDPSILFVGKLMLGNHFRAAEAQALFACGVLDGAVALPRVEQMEREIARTVAWCRRRYLGKGARGNWFYWDMVPYTDALLAAMGLRAHRQGVWWRDLLRPCYARDLRGLVGEYQRKMEGK